MGGGGQHTCIVDIEDGDDERPALGNQAGIRQGMAEECSDHDHQWVSQPGRSMERTHPSTRPPQPTSRNGTRDVLPDGQQTNRPVSHGARARAVFEELGGKAQKELLVDLVQDFA